MKTSQRIIDGSHTVLSFERAPISMSDELKDFYREYKAWLDDGAGNDHFLFKRRWGLCSNLLNFYHNGDRAHKLYSEMCEQFRSAGLPVDYPFNEGGESEYFSSQMSDIHHTNPARIKWVEEHAL